VVVARATWFGPVGTGGEAGSEAESPRRWQHRCELPSMRSSPIPWLGAVPMLASGSPARLREARMGLAETHHWPRRSARGCSGKRLPARRFVSAPFGAPRHPGWRVHPLLRQWLCSVVRTRRVTAFAFVMTSVEDSDLSSGNVGEGSFGRFVRSCRQLYGAWHASLVRL
jgi:hypothetical protein